MSVELRHYQAVPGLGESSAGYVIPNGQKFVLDQIGASGNPGSLVCVVFNPGGVDEEILLGTESEALQPSQKEFLGDGVKVIQVKLTNTNATTKTFGGYFIGRLSNA